MITLHPLIGISVLPTPIPEASKIECFKLVSINSSIAEIARKQEILQEVSNDVKGDSPKRTQEQSLNRGLPTPSLTPKMPRM